MSEMRCPTCGSAMLLVGAPGDSGNWCCERGAACGQRAIPFRHTWRRDLGWWDRPPDEREPKLDVIARDWSKP